MPDKIGVKKKLLVVDDEDSILVGMKRYFEAGGYDVDCAREREEAEALLAHVPYACLIADLCLTTAHGADGLDVVAYARVRCPSTRIVVLTAYGSPAVEAEARKLGADAFIRKPKPLRELLQVVAGLLGSE